MAMAERPPAAFGASVKSCHVPRPEHFAEHVRPDSDKGQMFPKGVTGKIEPQATALTALGMWASAPGHQGHRHLQPPPGRRPPRRRSM